MSNNAFIEGCLNYFSNLNL